MLQYFEMMDQGKVNGYICQGFNPLASAPNKAKVGAALAKLKWLVIMDPLVTETSEFWQKHGEYNDVDPAPIQTEVFRLPTTCFAEEDGSIVNSGRWLQWHWKGAEAPGEARSDIEIMSGLFQRLREMYQKDGGKYPDPIVNLTWPYANPESPTPEELAMEYNGKGAGGRVRPEGPDQGAGEERRAAGRLRAAARRRHHRERLLDLRRRLDAGRQPDGAARQQRTRPASARRWAGPGRGPPTGASSTTAPRATSAGKPWDPNRKLIGWNGSAWGGTDVPDYKADVPPEATAWGRSS